jgi:uncharacterized protein YecT (DUF1311 family)
MPSLFSPLGKISVFRLLAFAIVFLFAASSHLDVAARESRDTQAAHGPMQASPTEADSQQSQPQSQAPEQPAPTEPDEAAQPPKAVFDPAIFLTKVPGDQLAFLSNYDHSASGDVANDKAFRKLLKTVVPDCMFHYGNDMPLLDSIEMVLKNSKVPVEIRDGRYVTVSGRSGPYLSGKGFMWFDLQSGIALGGFYFHPTNGEPTPTLAVFSKQVKGKYLEMGQLPPAFADKVNQWSADNRVQPVLTRYFLTGRNERVLLSHDEDYCSAANSVSDASNRDCEQLNADAADIDMDAAYYLEQTHNATNATEWMALGEDQIAWGQVRDNTCGSLGDPLPCRIRMAHERTRVILTRAPQPHRPPTQAPHR